jgi:hypothetical protein
MIHTCQETLTIFKYFKMGCSKYLKSSSIAKLTIMAIYVSVLSISNAPSHITYQEDREKMQKHIHLRHGMINARLKNWRCLEERFCHGITKHLSCFRAVYLLTQLAIKAGESLFDCQEYDNLTVATS